MATCAMTEYVCPPKKRRLDKASGESKSSATRPELRNFNSDDDECIRQYISYHYQFQRSEGFEIDWDKLDYRFGTRPIIDAYRVGSTKTNDEIIRDVACRAIVQHNAEKGTGLVFLDHVSASYKWCGGLLYYITFWAMDLASSCPEPKLYQTKCGRCGPTLCEVYIFRLKPTDEEIAAVEVDPPPPWENIDPEVPTVVFTVTGPGSGSIPNVVFTRIPAQVSPESKSSATRPYLRTFNADDDECIRQYILYYYQFQRSEGFEIDWDKLDYRFATLPITYRVGSTKTDDELISEETRIAIAQHNAEKGTRLVFLDHVSASYRCCGGLLYYVTFRAMDLASSCPVPKLYQSNFLRCGIKGVEIFIFRLKPTDEEIAAVQVDPPPPLNDHDPEVPTVVFTVTGPGSGSIPNVVFTRIPPQVSPESSSP